MKPSWGAWIAASISATFMAGKRALEQQIPDFLEAPRRLLEFLDSKVVQLLFHPAMAASRFGFKLFNRTSQKALQVLERISGVGFLDDISEFLMAFEGMAEGFRKRATRVREVLLGPASGFLLVNKPRFRLANFFR